MLRVALAVVVAVLTLLPEGANAVAPAGEAPADRLGDADCSGSVNPVDSLLILRQDAALGDVPCADLADVQCDGDIDPVDSLQILRWDGGLSVSQQPGCVAIGEPLTFGPTSYDLIREAFDAGDLTAEESLTYRIFATFGDSRLPAEYQGDDSGVFDGTETVSELAATFDTLSPATQGTLAPFLKSWELPESWFQQRLATPQGVLPPGVPLETIDTSPNVRLWYRTDIPGADAEAAALVAEIDAKIWGDLTGLMGTPQEDSARVPNGGDDRLDILLSGLPNRAYARQDPGCKATSGYIVLGNGYSDKEVVTHEIMHAILFNFEVKEPCQHPEYTWINEATAQWAIDLVYPTGQREWGSLLRPTNALRCFLEHTNQSLESRNDCHEYGAYIFLFYLARFHGNQYVRAVWDSFAGNDSLAGINAALAPLGGLKEVWPKFEMQNFNREPRLEYNQKDSITIRAALEAEEDVTLGGMSQQTYHLRGDADHLGAFLHSYHFADSSIRQVKFTHSLMGQQTAYVRALIKYEGDSTWKDENWTPFPEKKFCYDDAGQKKIEKLVIIISNSEFQNRSHILASDPQPELEVRDQCGMTGTMTGTYHFDEGYHEDWTVTAEIEWIEDPDYFFGCPCRVFFPEGDINWSWDLGWESDYAEPPCHETYSGHFFAGQGLTDKSEQMLFLWEDPENEDQYFLSGRGYIEATWFSTCENGTRTGLTFFDLAAPELDYPTDFPLPTIPVIPHIAPAGGPDCQSSTFPVAADATTISGSCTDLGGLLEYEWNLRLAKASP
ncbi:MAG: hypothetical protein WD904_04050 [Dehalococcoidia bacterium]